MDPNQAPLPRAVQHKKYVTADEMQIALFNALRVLSGYAPTAGVNFTIANNELKIRNIDTGTTHSIYIAGQPGEEVLQINP